MAASEIAEKARIPIFFNPAPHAPVPAEFLQRCTFLIPNEAEAGQMSGVIIEDVASASTAARRLRDMAPRSVVVITLGAMGVWVETNEFAGHVPGFSVDAVDTVGAGDTFVGAFAVRILEGAGVRDAACFGCAAAALSVTRRGAQSSIPSRAEVESWLRGHA